MATEYFEIELGEYTADDGYVVNEYFPATRGLVTGLTWTYIRPGGCGELEFTLQVPYDRFGVDYKTQTGVKHFSDINLKINGVTWWRGYIRQVTRRITFPESVTVRSVGYSRKFEDAAAVTWRFSRHSIIRAGDIGGIPGVVRGFFHLLPLLLGVASGNLPHPAADTLVIDGTANLPRSLVFDQVSLFEAFSELATLAGNYDWGIDENRRFYFLRPQALTDPTAMYGVGRWSTNGSTGYYADETYKDPQPVPPYLDIESSAVFVVGGNVQTFDANENTEGSKNSLTIYGAPRDPEEPIVKITVTDPVWVEYWGQILNARISTPFLSDEDDLQMWGLRRIRLMGRPQLRGGVTVPFHDLLVHPLGACRIIDPSSGNEIEERIAQVRYSLNDAGVLSVMVELGYALPADQYFADQLRRDATVQQNAVAEAGIPTFLREKMQWGTISNLTGLLVPL